KTTKAKYAAYELSADKRSISLTLASPTGRELGNMTSFRVLPKHIYEGKTTLTDAELRFGCGPFTFESFSRDSGTITFVRNETYPQQANVKKLVYQLFDNEDTMFMALQSGDIDMVWAYSTGIAGSYQEVLAGSDKVQLISVNATNAPAVLAFNNANGPFADENLRHAVALALNYDDFRTYVGSAAADIPNAGFVPTSTVGFKQTAKLTTDFAKAEQFMNAAGYSKNDGGKFVDASGKTFAFTLTYRSDRPNQVSCAELIKTAIEAFGGEVTLDALDSDSYNAKTSNKFSENNITMEAALYGYTSAGMGMGNGLGTIYVDGRHAVQGGCQVYDEQFQSILAAMSAAKNLNEYIAAAGDMQDFYAAHTPLVGLYWDSLTYGISSRFENIVVDNAFGLNSVNNWLSITEK
ncbi:MAG: ABC transporter substrate-binding protein, partial [Oscillospiraceae bacterium]|nr:ABC transporter substrate-binding protein [Oscillospiraceae bacterium]